MLTAIEKKQIKETIKEKMWFSNKDGMIFIDELSDNHLINIHNQLRKRNRSHKGIEAEFNKRFNSETSISFERSMDLEMTINFYGY